MLPRRYLSMTKPTVLRLGPVNYAHAEWEELGKLVNVVPVASKNRAELIHDLQTKYLDAVFFARSPLTAHITGAFDEELVSHFPKLLRGVANFGAGYDDVDPYVLSKHGIQLCNLPLVVSPATADTNLFLILAAMRNFFISEKLMLAGKWPGAKCAGAPWGTDPKGRVLGILGMGDIGREVRDRCVPLGFAKIIYHNRSRLPEELEGCAEYRLFDDFLAELDVISINIPLNPGTYHMINAELIAKMKDGVIVVNTARGPVIDEKPFKEALKLGKIGHAGLDVFENEPNVDLELAAMPNVSAVPHMGTHTIDTVVEMEKTYAAHITEFLTTGTMSTLVPEQRGVEFDHTPVL